MAMEADTAQPSSLDAYRPFVLDEQVPEYGRANCSTFRPRLHFFRAERTDAEIDRFATGRFYAYHLFGISQSVTWEPVRLSGQAQIRKSWTNGNVTFQSLLPYKFWHRVGRQATARTERQVQARGLRWLGPEVPDQIAAFFQAWQGGWSPMPARVALGGARLRRAISRSPKAGRQSPQLRPRLLLTVT